jgi:hypothetical protein
MRRAQATLMRALILPDFSGYSVCGVVKNWIISKALAKLFCRVRSLRFVGYSQFCSSSSKLMSCCDSAICLFKSDSISSESDVSSKRDLTSSLSCAGFSYGELSVDIELPNWLLLKLFLAPKDNNSGCSWRLFAWALPENWYPWKLFCRHLNDGFSIC